MSKRTLTTSTTRFFPFQTLKDSAYELRCSYSEGVALYRRAELLLDEARYRWSEPAPEITDPCDFVRAIAVDHDQWQIIESWLKAQLVSRGDAAEAVMPNHWSVISLDRQLGLELHHLMEMAKRIWANPDHFQDPSWIPAATKETLLRFACELWKLDASPFLPDWASFSVAAIIQNAQSGPRSYRTGIWGGVLAVHVPDNLARFLATAATTWELNGTKNRGDKLSKWQGASSNEGAAIMLFDERDRRAKPFFGNRKWGLGPILTSAPICVEYRNKRDTLSQWGAILDLREDVQVLMETISQEELGLTAHEKLELHEALAAIDEEVEELLSDDDASEDDETTDAG